MLKFYIYLEWVKKNYYMLYMAFGIAGLVSFNLLDLEGSLMAIIYLSCGIYSTQWFLGGGGRKAYLFLMVIKIRDLLFIDFVFFRKTGFFFCFRRVPFALTVLDSFMIFKNTMFIEGWMYSTLRGCMISFFYGAFTDHSNSKQSFSFCIFILFTLIIWFLPQNIKLTWIYFISSLII